MIMIMIRLRLGLGLGLDFVSGWSVVMHTSLHYFRLWLSLTRRRHLKEGPRCPSMSQIINLCIHE